MYQNKTEYIKVRMSKREKEDVFAAAKSRGMSMSEYARTIFAHPPAVTKKEFDEKIVQVSYELRKIGVNINQIAKKYNENGCYAPAENLNKQLDSIYQLLQPLNELLESEKRK